MGQVHMARHRSGHLVAIKRVRNTLARDPVVADRLANEARMLQRVRHPNVVRALDSGHDHDGTPFLVMDRAHGTPLDVVVGKAGPLGFARVASIAKQLLAGLGAIHAAGVVHADVKSNNVMVDDADHVVIIDFGLARTMSRIDGKGLIAGTPSFMAPEVISGEAPTIAADIYAVGAIVYEMLTATLPFSGNSNVVLIRQLSDVIQAPSERAPALGITPAIDAVVLRAMARDPAERHTSAADLATALEEALLAAGDETPDLADLIELTTTRDFWGAVTTPLPRSPVDPVLQAAPTRPSIDTDTLITAALDRVRAMIEGKDIDAAIFELESTMSFLRPDEGAEVTPAIWRLQSVLAALYDHCGRSEAAARMARLAFQHATRTGSESAKLRARELVTRLANRPRSRMARGSKQIGFERRKRPTR